MAENSFDAAVDQPKPAASNSFDSAVEGSQTPTNTFDRAVETPAKPPQPSKFQTAEAILSGATAWNPMNPFSTPANYVMGLLQKARKEVEGLGERSVVASRNLQEMLPNHPYLGVAAAIPGTVAGDITKEIAAKAIPASRLDMAAMVAFPGMNALTDEMESVGLQAIGRTNAPVVAQMLRSIMEHPDPAIRQTLLEKVAPRLLGNEVSSQIMNAAPSTLAYHELDPVVSRLLGESAEQVFKTFKAGINGLGDEELGPYGGRPIKSRINSVGPESAEGVLRSFNPIQQRAILRRGAAALGDPELVFGESQISPEEQELLEAYDGRRRMAQTTADIRTNGMASPVVESPEEVRSIQRRSQLNLDYNRNVGKLRRATNDTLHFFKWDWNLGDFPVLKNDLEKASSAPRNLAIANEVRIRRMLSPILNDSKALESFRTLTLLNDWIDRASAGQEVMNGLPLDWMKAWRSEELGRLSGESAARVAEAQGNYYQMMDAMADDLVNRGIMNPESRKSQYFRHDVIRYLVKNDPELERDYPFLSGTGGSGSVKRGPRPPFREYLQKAYGSTAEIDTDVFRVMHRLMTKVSMDNYKDDLIIHTSEGFHNQVMSTLDDAQRKEFFGNSGVPTRTGEYFINGERKVGIRYALRGKLFLGDSDDERLFNSIVEDSLTAKEMDARVGPLAARQQFNKVYLVPTEVANELKRYSLGKTATPIYDLAVSQNRLWKRMVLTVSGTGLENKFGMSWAEAFIREFSLRNPGPSIAWMWKMPKAAFLMGKSIWTDEPAAPIVQKAMEEANLKLPLSGSPLQDPRLRAALHPLDQVAQMLGKVPRWLFDIPASLTMGTARLAKFMADMDLVKAGKTIPMAYKPLIGRYWAEKELEGLTAEQQVGKMARMIVPEFATNSREFNSVMRDLLFPFISFHYHSAANWAKYTARNPADSLIKFGGMYASMQMWNWKSYPKIEESLNPWQRYTPHIITPFKDKDGKQVIVNLQSTYQAAASLVKADALLWRVSELAAGRINMKQLVRGQLREYAGSMDENFIVSELGSLANPVIRAATEILANKKYIGKQSPPIVPDRLKGTHQGMALQAQHLMDSLFTFVSTYQRAQMQRDDEYHNPVINYLKHGPMSLDRLLGLSRVDLQKLDQQRGYLAGEDARVINNQTYADLHDAFVKMEVTGDSADYHRLIQSGKYREIPFPKGKSLRTYLMSPRVQIEVAEQKLDHESDLGKRRQLQDRIRALESREYSKFLKQAPPQERRDIMQGNAP